MENSIDKQVYERIFGMDVLRFLAIVFVVSAHGSFLAFGTPVYEFLYFIFIDGVDLFFALSGFLIGGILLSDITKTNSFSGTQLVHFWKRRWLRTLPNYYLILCVNCIIAKYVLGCLDICGFSWKHVVFLQNFYEPQIRFFPESWSLSIEEWFYIFAPLLLLAMLKALPLKKAFFVTILVFIIVPCIFRYLRLENTNDWYWIDQNVRKPVVTRLDAIGYGLLGAWLCFYYKGVWKKCRFWFLGLGFAMHFFQYYLNPSTSPFYLQVFSFSISSFTAMLFLPAAYSIKSVKGVVAKAITYISKISYSMYLVNLGVVAIIMQEYFPAKNTTDGVLKYFLYWFIVIALSGLIYKYFEKPIMNLRDKKRNVSE